MVGLGTKHRLFTMDCSINILFWAWYTQNSSSFSCTAPNAISRTKRSDKNNPSKVLTQVSILFKERWLRFYHSNPNSKVIDTYSVILFLLLGFFMKLLWSRYPTFLTYNEQANKRRKKNASIYWNINQESTKLLNCHSSPHLLRSVLSYSNSLLPCKWVYTVHNRTASNFMLLYIFL